MQPIRILLANHHPIIRSSLRSLLERALEFQVVAEAANGREAVMLAEYKHPDIILLEMALPDLKGMAVAKELTTKDDRSRILFVTAHAEEDYVQGAFKAGARGYVTENAAPVDLIPAIHAVMRGRLFLSPTLSRYLLSRSMVGAVINEGFSEYQKELCCLLAAGYDEQEAAKRMQREFDQLQTDLQIVQDVLEHWNIAEPLKESIRENWRLLEQAKW